MAKRSRRKPLSHDELGRQQGAELPDREAMSLIHPSPMPPIMATPPGAIDHPMPIEHPVPIDQPAPGPVEGPIPVDPPVATETA